MLRYSHVTGSGIKPSSIYNAEPAVKVLSLNRHTISRFWTVFCQRHMVLAGFLCFIGVPLAVLSVVALIATIGSLSILALFSAV